MGEREHQMKQDGSWVGTCWRRGTCADGGSLYHSVYFSIYLKSSLIKTFLKISHLAFSSPNTSSHLKYRFSAAKLVIIRTRLNQKLNSMQISTYFISKYLKSLLKIPFTRFDAPSNKQTTTKSSLRGDCVPGGIPRAVCTVARLIPPGVMTGNATTPILHVRNGVRDGINNVLRDTWSEVWTELDVLRIRLEFLGHKCSCPVRYSQRGRLRKVSEWAPSSWSFLLPSCAATHQTLACTHQPWPLAEHPPWVCLGVSGCVRPCRNCSVNMCRHLLSQNNWKD